MPEDVKPPTPQAPPNAAPPPDVPPVGGAASGAASEAGGDGKPKTSAEHAAIEAAKFRAREANRKLKESEARWTAQQKSDADARAKLEQTVADLQKQMEGLKSKPLHGRADAEAVIRDFVEGDTPEARTKAEIAEAKRIASETQATLDAKIKEFEDREKQGQAEAAVRARQQRVEGFASQALNAENAKKYPYLSAMHTQAEVRAMAAELDEWAEQEGKSFTFAQVAGHLDGRAKTLYEERKDRLAALHPGFPGGAPGAGSAPPTTTGRAGNGSAGNGHREHRPEAGARPLTGAALRAHERAQREKEEAEDLANLRKANATDTAARNREAKTAAAAKH